MSVKRHFLRQDANEYWYLVSEVDTAYFLYLMDIGWDEWTLDDDTWIDSQRIESPFNIPIYISGGASE